MLVWIEKRWSYYLWFYIFNNKTFNYSFTVFTIITLSKLGVKMSSCGDNCKEKLKAMGKETNNVGGFVVRERERERWEEKMLCFRFIYMQLSMGLYSSASPSFCSLFTHTHTHTLMNLYLSTLSYFCYCLPLTVTVPLLPLRLMTTTKKYQLSIIFYSKFPTSTILSQFLINFSNFFFIFSLYYDENRHIST